MNSRFIKQKNVRVDTPGIILKWTEVNLTWTQLQCNLILFLKWVNDHRTKTFTQQHVHIHFPYQELKRYVKAKPFFTGLALVFSLGEWLFWIISWLYFKHKTTILHGIGVTWLFSTLFSTLDLLRLGLSLALHWQITMFVPTWETNIRQKMK